MNELDAFLRDYAMPVLQAAGYTKKGRTYRLVNDCGDSAVVMFRPFQLGNLVDFLIDAGVAPAPVVEFAGWHFGRPDTAPDAFSGAWHEQWSAPSEDHPHGGNAWSVQDAARRAAVGATLQGELTAKILPLLTALLNRETLLDAIRSRGVPGHAIMGQGGIELALLADAGPSARLDAAMTAAERSTHPFDQGALAWARKRLAEHGYADDQWRRDETHFVDDPGRLLIAILERDVDAVVKPAGFSRNGTRYQLESGRGDIAVIEFGVSATSTPSRIRFQIQTAITPGPELDWRRYRADKQRDIAWDPVEPTAREGWLTRTVPPPTKHASDDMSPPAPDNQLWQFTADTALECGRDIANTLVRQVVPTLEPYLDRQNLLHTVLDPRSSAGVPYPQAKIILLVDDGPSDQLEEALQVTEAYIGPIDPELAAWARQRLAARK